jgi:hypothetical protein
MFQRYGRLSARPTGGELRGQFPAWSYRLNANSERPATWGVRVRYLTKVTKMTKKPREVLARECRE